jgi:hypothetical protein
MFHIEEVLDLMAADIKSVFHCLSNNRICTNMMLGVGRNFIQSECLAGLIYSDE